MKRRSLLAWLGTAVALVAASALGLFLFLFPVPSPPPLEGPHAVGTLTFEIPAREKIPRLLVQAWYPTDQPEEGKPSPWLPDPALAPGFPFHRIRNATARARSGAPLPNKTDHPVIFYEHSWTGHRAENIAQVESLASKGFVIVAIDHPGQAARVRYADGTVVPTRLDGSIDFTTSKGVAAFEASALGCLEQRISNVATVKQALIDNTVPFFKDRLKLDRLGVFGFSFGGTSALRLCARDSSFHAGANEDGLFLGDEMPKGPFFFFDQQMPAWLLTNPAPGEDVGQVLTRKAESQILTAMKQPSRYREILDGTTHDSFNDRIFLSRYPHLARAGKRPAAEIHAIIVNRLSEFFSRELQGNME
jgi:dienelactone hydrolase